MPVAGLLLGGLSFLLGFFDLLLERSQLGFVFLFNLPALEVPTSGGIAARGLRLELLSGTSLLLRSC